MRGLSRFFLCLGCSALVIAQEPEVKRPEDKPVNVTHDARADFEKMVAPCVALAKKSLPGAKSRYLAGLRKDELFSVTVRLSDPDGKYEVVFVRVQSWPGEVIHGFIDSDIGLIKSYKKNDRLEIAQSDVLDWTFSESDSTEDGNFIGKQIESPKHDYCAEPASSKGEPAAH